MATLYRLFDPLGEDSRPMELDAEELQLIEAMTGLTIDSQKIIEVNTTGINQGTRFLNTLTHANCAGGVVDVQGWSSFPYDEPTQTVTAAQEFTVFIVRWNVADGQGERDIFCAPDGKGTWML